MLTQAETSLMQKQNCEETWPTREGAFLLPRWITNNQHPCGGNCTIQEIVMIELITVSMLTHPVTWSISLRDSFRARLSDLFSCDCWMVRIVGKGPFG